MFSRLSASLTPSSYLPSALTGALGMTEKKYAASDTTDDDFASDTMSQVDLPKVGGARRPNPPAISNVPT